MMPKLRTPAGLMCLALAGTACRPLPVIEPDPVNFPSATPIKVVTADISQAGERLAGSLEVDCLVSVKLTPTQSGRVRRIAARQGSGLQWVCTVPEDFIVRRNEVLETLWRVANSQDVVLAEREQESFLDCRDFDAAMRAEQRTITNSFAPVVNFAQIVDGLNRINAAGELARNGQVKWVPTHNTTSFAGMGVAFIRADGVVSDLGDAASRAYFNLSRPRPGDPDLLLYAPLGASSPVDVGAPDDPYRLIGWAYAMTIPFARRQPQPPDGAPAGPGEIGPRPVFRCVPRHEWFLHTAGWHRSDGTFRPAQDRGRPVPGDLAPAVGGAPPFHHANMWDIHFFSSPAGAATIGITGPPVAGIASPANSFYYPTAYD